MTSESVLLHSKVLEVRFADTKSISGTRSPHCFKPLSRETLSLSRVSFEHKNSRTVHSFGATNMSDDLDENTFIVGVYVACVYDHDRKWFVGMILERCEEKFDVLVNIHVNLYGMSVSFTDFHQFKLLTGVHLKSYGL